MRYGQKVFVYRDGQRRQLTVPWVGKIVQDPYDRGWPSYFVLVQKVEGADKGREVVVDRSDLTTKGTRLNKPPAEPDNPWWLPDRRADA